MEIKEKIINTTVKNKSGEMFTISEFIAKETLEESSIRLDNGKRYSVSLTFKNGILIYEEEIADMLRMCFEKEEIAEKIKKESETVDKIIISEPNTNVLFTEEGIDSITSFRGENDFLSNFYTCSIEYNGYTYRNSEAAFQAQKDINRSSEFTTISGKSAKALGKKVSLRSDWDSVKVKIMEEIVRAKFTQNEDLKEKLLATGNKTLVEGNAWNDRFWGVCRGNGLNNLGKILMKIRAELSK